MKDAEIVADQLVNAWEVTPQEELVDHLDIQTDFCRESLEKIVGKWYSNPEIRIRMDLASPQQFEKWMEAVLKE